MIPSDLPGVLNSPSLCGFRVLPFLYKLRAHPFQSTESWAVSDKGARWTLFQGSINRYIPLLAFALIFLMVLLSKDLCLVKDSTLLVQDTSETLPRKVEGERESPESK